MPDKRPFDNLREHLESMFQFENNDLDFGIYKVLRLKQKEVQAFLDDDLERIVKVELSKAAQGAADAKYQKLASYIREETGPKYHALVVSPETVEEHQEKLRELVSGADDETELLEAIDGAGGVDPDLEDRVYNHLLSFFGRYYRNGDFGYNDRSLATYKVDYPPAEADYSGDDVLLHWKHKDSYYIKTANGFPTVRFEVDDRTIEYRLETGGEADEQARTRNNNKDDGRKHYALDRVEEADSDDGPVWRVVFRLAERSTPKADVFSAIMEAAFGVTEGLDEYLYRPGNDGKLGKSAFYDLEGDYDKVENGAVKGQGQLRLALDTYLNNIYSLDRHKDLGSNKDDRQAKLAEDETVQRLMALDRHLNRFYVGIDADYFVHKDLGGFLRREAERYVKDVVLSGVEGLLAEDRDETTFLVARAFYRVATRIIEFLAATEEFQKNVFLLKKKVVRTDWLVSVGKLSEWIEDDGERSALLAEIYDNDALRADWNETFEVEVADPNQLLLAYPTLPIDTRLFDREKREALKAQLLASCPDIEAATVGLVIGSENLQALRLLSGMYRSRAVCVYIDPPYNSPSSSILYKNDFKHSSWLSMMQDRLQEAKSLMDEDASLVVAIDENEQERFGLLLQDLFKGYDITAVSVVHNPRGIQGDNFSYNSEFAYFVLPNKGVVNPTQIPKEDWDYSNLRNWGGESERQFKNSKTFYPIRVRSGEVVGAGDVPPDDFHPEKSVIEVGDDTYEVWPIDSNGVERKWRYEWASLRDELDRVRVTMKGGRPSKVEIAKSTDTPKTVWRDPRYDAGTWGTRTLTNILGKEYLHKYTGGDSLYPKSIHTVEDCIAAVLPEEGGLVVDFFAGSGTTGQSVLNIRRKAELDDKSLDAKFILVEMGEYFEPILVERIRRVMFTSDWSEGLPTGGPNSGTVGVVKIQQLMQYEDVLDALHPDEGEAPDEVPIRYMYRPHEQDIRADLDLSRPFANIANVGKDKDEVQVDLLETYAYFRGLPPRRIGVCEVDGDHEIRWFRSGRHLVAFRDIDPGQDDADDLLALINSQDGVEVLHVNEYVDERHFAESAVSLRVVTANDFDRGASWS